MRMKNERMKLFNNVDEDCARIFNLRSLISNNFTIFGCLMRLEAPQLVVALSKMEVEDIATMEAGLEVVYLMGLFGVWVVEQNKVEL